MKRIISSVIIVTGIICFGTITMADTSIDYQYMKEVYEQSIKSEQAAKEHGSISVDRQAHSQKQMEILAKEFVGAQYRAADIAISLTPVKSLSITGAAIKGGIEIAKDLHRVSTSDNKANAVVNVAIERVVHSAVGKLSGDSVAGNAANLSINSNLPEKKDEERYGE